MKERRCLFCLFVFPFVFVCLLWFACFLIFLEGHCRSKGRAGKSSELGYAKRNSPRVNKEIMLIF